MSPELEIRIKTALANSPLTEEEQVQFFSTLATLDDALIVTAAELFQTEPHLVGVIWDTANEKLAALNGKADPTQVVREEIEALKE